MSNANDNGGLRVDGYIRVSRAGKGPGYHTKQEQREQIERYVERQGWELVKVWSEEDVSAKSMKRKGHITEIIRRVVEHEVQGVVVLRVNRFGRNQLEGLNAVAELHKAGGRLVGAEDGFDTSDINIRRYVLPTLLGLAESKIEEGAANAESTARDCFARGVFQGRTPFGYIRNGVYDADGQRISIVDPDLDGRALVPDLATGPIVTELFQRRAQGATLHSLRTWLNGEGVPTSQGTTWTSAGVRRLLERDVYLGTIHSRGEVKERAHARLTDPATFRRAQRPGMAPLRKHATDGLLTGLARCSGCCYAMRVERRAASNGAVIYVCRRHRSNDDCAAPVTVTGSHLDKYVLGEFWEFMDHQTFEPTGEESRLSEIQEQLDLARAEQLDWARNKRPSTVGGKDIYDEGLEARRVDVEALEREYESELRRLDRPTITGDARQLRRDWEEGRISLEEQRRLLSLAITAVMVRRPANGKGWRASPQGLSDRVYVAFRPEALDLPRGGRGGVSRPRVFRFPDDPRPT